MRVAVSCDLHRYLVWQSCTPAPIGLLLLLSRPPAGQRQPPLLSSGPAGAAAHTAGAPVRRLQAARERRERVPHARSHTCDWVRKQRQAQTCSRACHGGEEQPATPLLVCAGPGVANRVCCRMFPGTQVCGARHRPCGASGAAGAGSHAAGGGCTMCTGCLVTGPLQASMIQPPFESA